jgi:hypothetical protein
MMGMTRRLTVLIIAIVFALAIPAVAHHALQAEFDITTGARHWTGTLKSVEWVNPHSRFVIDVPGEGGKVTSWTFETASPNGLRRIGFTKTGFFELGKTYTIIGYPARDGSALAFVEQLTLPDGRTVRIWFGDPNGSN